MLGRGPIKGGSEEGKEKSFQEFNCRVEKGDGVIGEALVRRFTQFDKRDDHSRLPDSRDVRPLERQVEEQSQILHPLGAQTLEMERRQAIRTSSR